MNILKPSRCHKVFHSWSLQYAFDPATTSDVVHGSEVLKLDCVRKCVCKSRPVQNPHFVDAKHTIYAR